MTINYINPKNDIIDIKKIMINMINMISTSIQGIINITDINEYNKMLLNIFKVVSSYLKFFKFRNIGINELTVQILNQFANVIVEFVFTINNYYFIYKNTLWKNFIIDPITVQGLVYKNLSETQQIELLNSIVNCETFMIEKEFVIENGHKVFGIILNKNFKKNCECSCSSVQNIVSIYWINTS